MQEKVKLTIRNSDYYINTDGDKNELEALGKILDEKLAEIQSNAPMASVTQCAVFACLEYMDRITKLEREISGLKSQIKGYHNSILRANEEINKLKGMN